MKTKPATIHEADRPALTHTILFGGPCRFGFLPSATQRRRINLFRLAGFLCFVLLSPCLLSSAATLLVWPDSPNPTPPYTNWATAAQTIQAAVDAAQAGDTVLVTNGVYSTAGRAVYGFMTNRVAVDKAITVLSVNGPTVTVIAGAEAPGGGNGDGAIRCAYVGTNAVLSGFTLTNGHTRAGGHYLKEESGGGAWCELSGLVTNCALSGNWAQDHGGAAYSGMLNNCTLTGNRANLFGGGAYSGTLNNCTLSRNSAYNGGGAYFGALMNCTLTGNSAGYNGGAACEITWTLTNCTLTGNSATYRGGGCYDGSLKNCIVYHNTARFGPNYYGSAWFDYSCTTPLPTAGTGNIEADPLLGSATHLSAQSPCIGRGSATYSVGVDIDGEAWLNPPCIGADQFVAGNVTGPITVAIAAAGTNIRVGISLLLQALVDGRLLGSAWEFGDGVVVSNQPLVSHAWALPGQYSVRLTGYNESNPGGVSATVLVQVLAQQVYYVNRANTTPAYPYTSWSNAATNIQDAVDAGTQFGRLVVVADGIYDIRGRPLAAWPLMTNRVVLAQGVEVQSVNGPATTVIAGAASPGGGNGDSAIRCAYVGSNAVLSGFTLTNGHTRSAGDYYSEQRGGGAWCDQSGVITNCVLSGNSASWDGGGAYFGTLKNCALIGNRASYYGGGADYAVLINCILTGNVAGAGGGAYDGTLYNCTLIDNWATNVGGGVGGCALTNCILYYNTGSNYYESTFAYSCTTPMWLGPGNITNEPGFVEWNLRNLRLQTNSPCINAGNNAPARGTTDLDGRPRIVGPRVDMGAYEYQGPGFSQFIPWLAQYGLPTDGSADYTDPDGDGLNNWQEWLCGTDPTNALSALRLLAPTTNLSGMAVTWLSVTNHTYSLDRATNLAAHPAFLRLATGIPGQPGTTTYTDTNAPGSGPSFYRIGLAP